jgi:hypothetical protein
VPAPLPATSTTPSASLTSRARPATSTGPRVGVARKQRGARWVAPSANRLLGAATRLLPAANQARYAEEYRSELWEIAYAGHPRRSQLRYASRQVVSSLHLRAELLSPHRRKASP